MLKALLPSCFIALCFIVLWLIKYPSEIWMALTFRNIGSPVDVMADIAIWIFLVGAITAITVTVNHVFA